MKPFTHRESISFSYHISYPLPCLISLGDRWVRFGPREIKHGKGYRLAMGKRFRKDRVKDRETVSSRVYLPFAKSFHQFILYSFSYSFSFFSITHSTSGVTKRFLSHADSRGYRMGYEKEKAGLRHRE